jgi:hypothetical protein
VLVVQSTQRSHRNGDGEPTGMELSRLSIQEMNVLRDTLYGLNLVLKRTYDLGA